LKQAAAMNLWQVDFYRRPLTDAEGNVLWELLICGDSSRETEGDRWQYSAFCPQPQVNAKWLVAQFQQVGLPLPDRIQVFRPQSLSLLETACTELGMTVEPTRRMVALKQLLQARAKQYAQMPGFTGEAVDLTKIEQPPTLPFPDHLWGDKWQFASLTALDLHDFIDQQPIPFVSAPPDLVERQLKLPPTSRIPGVVIYGGRRSLKLVQWLQDQTPASLHFIQGEPSGLVLAAGLSDRWILVTFEDSEVIHAAKEFEQRKLSAQGLHFLLVQPDDSGITFTGICLLAASD
jgi:RNA-binding protein Tab2/Atab2